ESSVAWIVHPYRIELAGALYSSATAAISSHGADQGAHFQRWTAGARAGYGWLIGRLSMGPLVGISLDHLTANGFGGTQISFDAGQTFASASIGALTELALSNNVAIRMRANATVPLSRPSFVVVEPAPEPSTQVFQSASVTGELALGCEIRF